MNTQLVEQIHALPEEEQLETLEALLSGTTLGIVVKLVPRLEEAWGVEAKPQMPDGFGPPKVEEEEEEQTAFTVVMTEIADKKIQVIKTVRQVTQLDLKSAKALVDQLPAEIKKDLDRAAAEEMKKTLEDAGAVVTIK